MCLDMNHFYSELVHEEERRRVESLEPFDEHEVGWSVCGRGLRRRNEREQNLLNVSPFRSGTPNVPTTSSSRRPGAL